MSEDSSSLVESWLARPGTRKEVEAAILHFRRYHNKQVTDTITEFQATMFALAVEILATIELFGGDEPTPPEVELGGFDPEDEDDDDEPWRKR